MLTSDEALKELIEKEKKKKKRKKKLSKRDRRKKLEKQEEKAWKDEIRLKKQSEKAAKKKSRRKQTDVKDPNPVVESDVEPGSLVKEVFQVMKFPIMSVHFALVCMKMICHQQDD